MKKWMSILFLSLYLVSTTELNQLLKLPILIEHYNEHHKLNPDMTVLAFFKAHYDHPAKDADHNTDRKLPFLMHYTISLVFTINTLFNIVMTESHYKHDNVHKFPSLDENFFVKGYLHSIWQPPRRD